MLYCFLFKKKKKDELKSCNKTYESTRINTGKLGYKLRIENIFGKQKKKPRKKFLKKLFT